MNRMIGSFVVQWLVLAVSVWVAAELVPGIRLDGLGSIAAIALILGLLNVFVRPVLAVLFFPLVAVTLGLFLLVINIVINSILLWLTDVIAARIGGLEFSIDSFFWDVVLGAVIIGVVGWLINLVVRR